MNSKEHKHDGKSTASTKNGVENRLNTGSNAWNSRYRHESREKGRKVEENNAYYKRPRRCNSRDRDMQTNDINYQQSNNQYQERGRVSSHYRNHRYRGSSGGCNISIFSKACNRK